MLVIFARDTKDDELGQIAINPDSVACVCQNGDDVDIYFKGDSDPAVISNTTTVNVVTALKPHFS